MSSAALQIRCYTPEEYLMAERKSPYKSEYFGGQIYAMAGASRKHNLITSNLNSELRFQFKGRSCETYTGDMRVRIPGADAYFYPDVVALCGEPQFDDAQSDTLLNPMVITEVLSPSSEAYDRGDKFASYRRITSLCEYILIAQDRIHIEHYVRQQHQWTHTELNNPDDLLYLKSVGCEIELREIYDKVTFQNRKLVTIHHV
jgi:Uma2 family endonuclease